MNDLRPAGPGVPAVVTAWFSAWADGDVDRLAALYGTDGRYEDVPSGLSAIGPKVADFAGDFLDDWIADGRWNLVAGYGAGERAFAEWTLDGRNRSWVAGDGAAGKSFSVRGLSVFELTSDGSVRRSSDYYDVATALRQLGALLNEAARPNAQRWSPDETSAAPEVPA